MARQPITDRTLLKTYKVPKGRLEIWDDLLSGFGVRITGRGIKSFFVFTRLHGQALRVTLGTYPATDLSSAREAARKVLQDVQRGEDPRQDRKGLNHGTIDHLVDEFAARHLSKLKPKSAESANRLLRNRFLERFSGRTPADTSASKSERFWMTLRMKAVEPRPTGP